MDENQNLENTEMNTSNSQNPGDNTQDQGYTYWESQQGSSSTVSPQYTTQNSDTTNIAFTSNATVQEPKKKKHKGLIAALILILIVVAGAGVALANKAKLMNVISLSFKSPKEYYTTLANKNLDDLTESLDLMASQSKKKFDGGYKGSLQISYDKDSVNSLLTTATGFSISDIENSIGIPLDSIGMNFTAGMKDSVIYENVNLLLNKTELLGLELFMNMVEEKIFIRLPEFSPAYLTASFENESLESVDLSSLTSLFTDTKEITKLIRKYYKIVIDNVEDVELTKNEKVTIDDLSQKTNLITITLDSEDILNIFSKILEEAKNDKFFINFAKNLGMSKEEYQDAIKEALSELSDSEDTDESVAIIIDLYVDDKGEIVGREIKFEEDKEEAISFAHYNVVSGSDEEYEIYVTAEGHKLFYISGEHSNNKGSYTGEAEFSISPLDGDTYKFNIDYKDVKTEVKDGITRFYGKYSISSLVLMGSKIKLNMDVKNDVQKSDIIFSMGGSDLVTLSLTGEYIDSYDIPNISSNAVIYDANLEADAYAATIDIEALITNLSDKLGIDLETLINNFDGLSYYLY